MYKYLILFFSVSIILGSSSEYVQWNCNKNMTLGDWNDPNNWEPTNVPNITSLVYIPNSPCSPLLNKTTTVNNIINHGKLYIQGSTLMNLEIHQQGELQLYNGTFMGIAFIQTNNMLINITNSMVRTCGMEINPGGIVMATGISMLSDGDLVNNGGLFIINKFTTLYILFYHQWSGILEFIQPQSKIIFNGDIMFQGTLRINISNLHPIPRQLILIECNGGVNECYNIDIIGNIKLEIIPPIVNASIAIVDNTTLIVNFNIESDLI